VVFFFFFAICADFDYHGEERRSHIKNFVQTGHFRSFYHGRTAYNVYYANFFEDCIIYIGLYEPKGSAQSSLVDFFEDRVI
jgi:hypothetical protein